MVANLLESSMCGGTALRLTSDFLKQDLKLSKLALNFQPSPTVGVTVLLGGLMRGEQVQKLDVECRVATPHYPM